MILYKYLSFNSGKKLIENGRIGFTTAEHFNDPFELRAVNLNFETNPKMNNISEGAFRNRCNGAYAILSLTRQPLNALMWSHYGDSHRGMVVGIDIDEAGLNCEDMNLIPAKYGEIIYTATKPTKKLSAPAFKDRLRYFHFLSK
ncbi:hypothetical protein THMIRHAS_03250 [Thiosulfatimonas sediminis]|uniref:DUF2971 domain-containing protein n=1 Tax=Thiosulfatimonas sediminis TaxID=2675054 RepID=A0A6F8PS42_9GAMM|nr:DUF2971 domain-containing protein [Thiosulfatimonas sediminis]BBP44952.1 hypothetical protein THMIRHAS_03250 [Thiosulfatimonas sediminis]